MKSYSFVINGQKYKTCVKSSMPGVRIVEVNGVAYGVEIEGEREAINLRKTSIEGIKTSKGQSSFSTIATPRKKAPADGINAIVSPIPGLVLDIQVSEGDKVSAGDVLLKMEAMKMENEIKSTKNGTVTKIYVKKGDSVLEGQELVTVE